MTTMTRPQGLALLWPCVLAITLAACGGGGNGEAVEAASASGSETAAQAVAHATESALQAGAADAAQDVEVEDVDEGPGPDFALQDPVDAPEAPPAAVADAAGGREQVKALQLASSVRADDVLGSADATTQFGAQNWNIECEGKTGYISTVPESGLSGSTLEDGATLKFGRVRNPQGWGPDVLVFRSNKRNRWVSGAPRCEGSFSRQESRIPKKQVFWQAMTVWIDNWSDTGLKDRQLVTQWHHGADGYGLQPVLGLYMRKDEFSISAKYDTHAVPSSGTTVNKLVYRKTGGMTGRWVRIVMQGRISPNMADNPFMKVWVDGNLVASYSGPLGYYVDAKPKMKFGIYKWMSSANPWDMNVPTRKVYLRQALLLRDPDGRYGPSQLFSSLSD